MTETRSSISRRSILRGALLTSAAIPFGLTLAACDSSGPDPDAEGPVDLSDKMVGAMEGYDVGTTFVASEPFTISMLYRDHPNYPYDAQWPFLQHIEQDNKVTFDFTSVPLSDFDDRKNLLISAGDAPDVITATYVGTVNQFIPSGALLPISRYTEFMPNFTAKVEAWGMAEELDRYRAEDGEFYVLPGLLESAKPTYTIAIREDLWEEAGLTSDPATFDEFREQLQTIKDTFPDIAYPLSDRWNSGGPMEATLSASGGSFGVRAGWGYGDGAIWNGSEFEYIGASQGYRELMTFYAGLVADGLMDPESLTQDDETAIQKLVNGQSAAIGSNDQEILIYRQNLADGGNADARMRQIVVPAGPAGDVLDAGTATRFESGLAFSSGAADKDTFMATLQFVDWLYYSDEGLEFAKWGVEGETFTVGSDGKRELMPDIDINGLNPGAPEMLNTDYGYHNGVFMPAHGSTQDLLDSMLREEVVEFRAAMNAKEVSEAGPGYVLTELDQEQASLQQSALKDAVYQNTAAFILGQRSVDEWDAYVAELESAGMTNYMTLINDSIRS